MTNAPIFEVNGNSVNDLERAQWLRDIYAAACQHVRNCEEPLHEACYWPGSIKKIDHRPINLTIYWSDAISMSCFRWAFEAAWNALGDDTPVVHVAMDELREAEFDPDDLPY
jgi:hypothetical protein